MSWALNFVLLQVATFILQKILLDDTGLAYICQTYERFSHVAMILVSSFIYPLCTYCWPHSLFPLQMTLSNFSLPPRNSNLESCVTSLAIFDLWCQLGLFCGFFPTPPHFGGKQGKMVLQLSKEPSARLLKHVVRCYLRLSDNPR